MIFAFSDKLLRSRLAVSARFMPLCVLPLAKNRLQFNWLHQQPNGFARKCARLSHAAAAADRSVK